ncbi:MAG: O-antigen ligase [Campylobacterota bacterium]|nr:O-antigen ligase [Campylobacterota bacterium]MDQ1337846.1 O-antigen ligase [Campylobacterota bacterium]
MQKKDSEERLLLTSMHSMTTKLEKTTYISVLLFAFTLPLSKSAISFFLLWFFVLLLYKKEFKESLAIIKSSSIFPYMALFLSYMCLSLLWSEDIKEGLNQMRLYGYWLLVLPYMIVLVKKEWLERMIDAFLLGMFVSEILAYGIFFDIWSINGRTPEYPSPFMTHIHYSVFLAFTSILLLHKVLSKNFTLYAKLPYLIFFLISTTNLMFSIGRTGQLAFFTALGVLIFLKQRVSLKSLLITFVSIAAIFLLAYNSLNLFEQRVKFAKDDIEKISNENYHNSFGLRIIYWYITLEALKEQPLLGSGIGDYIVESKKVLQSQDYGLNEEAKKFLTDHHYHNQYLMIAVQGGLIGLLLMFLMFLHFFKLKIKNSEFKEISILGFVIILISFIAEPLWILQFPNTLFLFITSISIVASKDDSDIILKTKERTTDE